MRPTATTWTWLSSAANVTVPVKLFTEGVEPSDPDAPTWRFMNLRKFKDLLATSELFFNRADRFPQDEQEGIPPEEYIIRVRGLNPLDVKDRLALNNDLATLAQFRESMYVNCWYQFDEEKAFTWKTYGEDGVAVVSTYSRLKAVLAVLPLEDDAHLGIVRYGMKHLTRYNTMMFITTKREEFANDKEVRAMLWHRDDYAGINRHYDVNNFPRPRPLTALDPARVKDFHRRQVDIATLVTEIVVNPKATPSLISEVQEAVRNAGYAIPVRESDLARYCRFLPLCAASTTFAVRQI